MRQTPSREKIIRDFERINADVQRRCIAQNERWRVKIIKELEYMTALLMKLERDSKQLKILPPPPPNSSSWLEPFLTEGEATKP